MQGQPKEEVTLIPNDVSGTIQWTMIHGGHYGQGNNYPDVDLGKDPNYDIKFSILDINGLGITFDPRIVDNNSSPKAINAIWIADGSGSAKVAGAYPDQISQAKLQKLNNIPNTQLIVRDKNSDDSVLNYQLNFVDTKPPTQVVPPIDPEIRNNGGGRGFDLNMDAVAAVLGLVALALVGLLWVSHFRNRARG